MKKLIVCLLTFILLLDCASALFISAQELPTTEITEEATIEPTYIPSPEYREFELQGHINTPGTCKIYPILTNYLDRITLSPEQISLFEKVVATCSSKAISELIPEASDNCKISSVFALSIDEDKECWQDHIADEHLASIKFLSTNESLNIKYIIKFTADETITLAFNSSADSYAAEKLVPESWTIVTEVDENGKSYNQLWICNNDEFAVFAAVVEVEETPIEPERTNSIIVIIAVAIIAICVILAIVLLAVFKKKAK